VPKRYNIITIALDVKTITSREAGFDCHYVVKGETEEDVMRKGAEHAMKDHGMKEEDITPELRKSKRTYLHYVKTLPLIFI
jgi:predicted small metal-binding protein